MLGVFGTTEFPHASGARRKHIDMTMKYAEFHPSYSDQWQAFEQVGVILGLSEASASDAAFLEDRLGDTPSKKPALVGADP